MAILTPLYKLQQAIKAYQERVKANVDMENGMKRYEVYNVQRRVAQAAINYGGYIVTGTRHYCPIMRLQIDSVGEDLLLELAGGLGKVVQGFTDQYGQFLTRQEAYVIARDAGQLLPIHTFGETLFSESYI